MQTKKIAKNTIFLYLRFGLSLIITLFTVRIVLEGLGDVDYGIYNVVAGFVLLFGFFFASLTNGVQRFYNYEIGQNGITGISKVLKAANRIQLILSIFILLIIETVGVWYLNYHMVIPVDKIFAANCVLQFSLVALLFMMLQVPYSAALIATEKMDMYAYVGIADILLKLGIAYLVMLFSENRLILYSAMLLLIYMFNFSFLIYYTKKHIKQLYLPSILDKKLLRRMVTFMAWNTVGSGSYLVRTQGINLLFNYFFGVLLNTANGIANQISGAVSHFATNLVLAFKPQLVQNYAAGKQKESFNLMMLMTRISFVLIYFFAIPIILDIDYILQLWLGNNVPQYTSSLSVLVLLSICISCWHTPIVQMIHTIGKLGKFQVITSIIILSIIPLTWIFFKLYHNPNMAYYVTIAVYIINQVAAMIVLKSLFVYSIKDYIKDAIIPCLIFAILYPVIPVIFSHFYNPSILQLLALIIISLISALPLFYYIILTKQERSKLSNYILSHVVKKRS